VCDFQKIVKALVLMFSLFSLLTYYVSISLLISLSCVRNVLIMLITRCQHPKMNETRSLTKCCVNEYEKLIFDLCSTSTDV